MTYPNFTLFSKITARFILFFEWRGLSEKDPVRCLTDGIFPSKSRQMGRRDWLGLVNYKQVAQLVRLQPLSKLMFNTLILRFTITCTPIVSARKGKYASFTNRQILFGKVVGKLD